MGTPSRIKIVQCMPDRAIAVRSSCDEAGQTIASHTQLFEGASYVGCYHGAFLSKESVVIHSIQNKNPRSQSLIRFFSKRFPTPSYLRLVRRRGYMPIARDLGNAYPSESIVPVRPRLVYCSGVPIHK